MADGWKYLSNTASVDYHGIVGTEIFAGENTNMQGCGNAPGITHIDGRGAVMMLVPVVANLGSGNNVEIGGQPNGWNQGSKGNFRIRVKDASGVPIPALNLTQFLDDGNGFPSMLIDAAVYDPNLAQYATLFIELSMSGKVINGSMGWSEFGGTC